MAKGYSLVVRDWGHGARKERTCGWEEEDEEMVMVMVLRT